MCVICENINKIKSNQFSPLVSEFNSSYLILGEHQYFKGYCVLIHKECVEDITDMNSEGQSRYLSELMMAAQKIKTFFKADRINYSCLGNVVPHLHFHIFPRYKDELKAKVKKDPWANADDFIHFKLNDEENRSLAKELRSFIFEK
jgi:diadenosine tetraphosphate (Ap4A) HIT family hydrolase